MDYRKLLGTPLGEGSTRIVYRHKHDPGLVIKRSKHLPAAANWREWVIWDQIRDTTLSNLFGRIVSISPTGKYLIMEYLKNLEPTDSVPAFPVWFTDRKRSNVGMTATGQIRARDYAQASLSNILVAATYAAWPTKQATDGMSSLIDMLKAIEREGE